MMESYCGERRALFDLFLRDRESFLSGRLWTLDPSAIRFRHGEDLLELKIPYHLGAEDEAIIGKAVYGLGILLKRRFEEGSSDIPHDINVGTARPLKDKTFKTDTLLSGTVEREIAAAALHTAPFMDGAILSNWLGPDGHGRGFIQWFQAIMEKTMKEEAANEKREKTSYLALLAIINSIRKKKDGLKKLRVKGLSYDKADVSTAFVLNAAVRGSLAALLARLKESGAQYYSPVGGAVLTSAVSPGAFLSIPANLLATSLNPYGIGQELYDSLLPRVPDLDGVTGSEGLISALAAGVEGEKAVVEAANLQYNLLEFRRLALGYLMEFDAPGVMGHKLLYDLYCEDRLLRNLFGAPPNEAMIEKVKRAMNDVRAGFSKDLKRVASIDGINDFLSGFEKRSSQVRDWFKKSVREGEKGAVSGVFEGFLACWFDSRVEGFTRPMRMRLVDRREAYGQERLVSEYRVGRLYRFSVDSRPVLSMLAVEEEGQLFVDMKDFSRRTLKVKEIAMAEFMKENFYGPILDAAARYESEAGLLETEGGIRLQSLPGDAAIFSGGVARLISLAFDIRRVIRQYREKLLARLLPEKGELLPEEITARFKEKKDEIRKKKAELEARLKQGDEGAGAALNSLIEKSDRLDDVYRSEIEAAVVRELEAGLFISYGAKAECVAVDGGHGGGGLTVAIGGKINEAARGTARNARMRARLEILLEKERIRRNNPRLRYPFDVYVGMIHAVRIPPDFDGRIEAPAARKDMATGAPYAKAIATWVARECYNDFKRLSEGAEFSTLRAIERTVDIYNRGQAISEEALRAYMRETKGEKFFFKKTVVASALDRSIQENFFLASDTLEFWFCHEAEKGAEFVEAFRRAGEVTFRGFESAGPTVVYEIINTDGEFFKALETHHVREWLDEAKGKTG
ncbi:MAG: hypothetical protein HY890_05740 [Deltaproteobacteria bacterium]|nr:hypothetical protein [Deltaproteobacteria bacterium]